MANEFHSEVERLRAASPTSSLAETSAADQQLSSLQNEIDQAKYAKQACVECARDGDALKVQVKGHAVAFWRVKGGNWRSTDQAVACPKHTRAILDKPRSSRLGL